MLRYKKDNSEVEKKGQDQTTLGNLDESTFFIYEKEDVNDPAHKWVKKLDSKTKDGNVNYTMWQKPQPGKSVNVMKNIMTLKGIKGETMK